MIEKEILLVESIEKKNFRKAKKLLKDNWICIFNIDKGNSYEGKLVKKGDI